MQKHIFIVLAALVLLLPSPAVADMRPNSKAQDCEKSDINAALDEIRASNDFLRDELDLLSSSKTFTVIITPIYADDNRTEDLPSGCELFWNLRYTGEKYPGSVCKDPIATLAHELQHCVDKMTHRANETLYSWVRVQPLFRFRETMYQRQFELDGVTSENLYRNKKGLCARYTYGEDLIPEWYDVKNCTPTTEPCTATRQSKCTLYCCHIYGGIKEPDGSWKACNIDGVTREECERLYVKNQNNINYSVGCPTPYPLCP